ncbi:MAG: TldD/PmbA family protein [Deltaproteobacteria bacterium]|nr:TldD/PmbA family protein [Deltaproteobacteria bacterium]
MQSPMIEIMTENFQKGLETAKNLGANAAKFGFSHVERTDCSFEAGRLKDTGGSEAMSYSIEILLDGRRGNSSGNRIEDLDAMIERAVALARVGSAAHFDAFPPPSSQAVTVKVYSDETLSLTREKMIQECQRIADALKAYNPDLFIECSADRTESETLLMTSGGVSHSNKRTHWGLGGFIQSTQGTDMISTGTGRGWCGLNEFFDPNAISERIVSDLTKAETLADSPQGKVTVFLPPLALARMISPVFIGTNGRNVAKGDSPLAGRLGEQVLAGNITILDDPHRDFASGSRSLDSNGIPTRKQTIFKNGILQRFLYDLDSAGLAKTEPTGNSGSNPHSPHIVPGDRTSEELLAGIKDGLFIRDLIGFGQSNITNGDFSSAVGLGFRVKNGKIVGRVKNTMIAGNIYDVFKENVQLSSDTNYDGRFPHAVVQGISVSAKG